MAERMNLMVCKCCEGRNRQQERLAIGGWQLAVGCWRLAAGGWLLASMNSLLL